MSRTPRNRRGFTLLEAMFATLVLGILIAAFFQMLSTSRRQLALSSHSLLSLQISGKVLADLREDARVNTTWLELIQEFPDLQTTDQIIDGRSAYFRILKDRQAPWGELDPARDGGIVPAEPSLYEQMRPFTVGVTATRGDPGRPGERHLARAEVRIDWQEPSGQNRSTTVPTFLTSPQGPEPLEPFAWPPDSQLHDLIRARLFPTSTSSTLTGAVAAAAADFALVEAIGRLVLLDDALQQELGALASDVQRLRAERDAALQPPGPRLVRLQMRLAQKLDQAASTLFFSLLHMAPIIQEIKDRSATGRLGTLPRYRFEPALRRYPLLPGHLQDLVRQVVGEYEWALEDGLRLVRSHRETEMARGKALDGHRLLACLDPARRTLYEGFVRRERLRQKGRNPYWEKLYLREERLMRSLPNLRTAFASLDQICTRLETEITAAVAAARLLSPG